MFDKVNMAFCNTTSSHNNYGLASNLLVYVCLLNTMNLLIGDRFTTASSFGQAHEHLVLIALTSSINVYTNVPSGA